MIRCTAQCLGVASERTQGDAAVCLGIGWYVRRKACTCLHGTGRIDTRRSSLCNGFAPLRLEHLLRRGGEGRLGTLGLGPGGCCGCRTAGSRLAGKLGACCCRRRCRHSGRVGHDGGSDADGALQARAKTGDVRDSATGCRKLRGGGRAAASSVPCACSAPLKEVAAPLTTMLKGRYGCCGEVSVMTLLQERGRPQVLRQPSCRYALRLVQREARARLLRASHRRFPCYQELRNAAANQICSPKGSTSAVTPKLATAGLRRRLPGGLVR